MDDGGGKGHCHCWYWYSVPVTSGGGTLPVPGGYLPDFSEFWPCHVQLRCRSPYAGHPARARSPFETWSPRKRKPGSSVPGRGNGMRRTHIFLRRNPVPDRTCAFRSSDRRREDGVDPDVRVADQPASGLGSNQSLWSGFCVWANIV